MEGMLPIVADVALTSSVHHKSGLAPNHKIWAGLDKRARPVFYVSNIARYRPASAPCVLVIYTVPMRRHEVCALCFSDPPGPQARKFARQLRLRAQNM
jgi:hypothetical protein